MVKVQRLLSINGLSLIPLEKMRAHKNLIGWLMANAQAKPCILAEHVNKWSRIDEKESEMDLESIQSYFLKHGVHLAHSSHWVLRQKERL